MRTLFFFACLALLGGAALFYLMDSHSGYVLIALDNTSVEMTFWLAILLVLGIFAILWAAVWLLRNSTGVLAAGANRVLYGHVRSVQKRTARGLIDFMEGNWKQAKRHLLRSAHKADTPLINYLAASRSAFELGEKEEALALLHKAEESTPTSELAVALTQARMQLLAKQYEQCVATLERAKKISPKHPVVLELLKLSYTQLRDWKALQKILPDLQRHKVYQPEEIETIEHDIYLALISDTGERAKRLLGAERLKLLEETWQTLPSHMQKHPGMVAAYVEQLNANGDEVAAESLLRRTLIKKWDERLVRLYGLVKGEDVQKQLLTAESWLQDSPGSAALMLALGRLCLRNELWGKARDYFESSLRLHKNPDTFAELARLLAHLGEHERSTEHYQQGLLMMTDGLPELPMPQTKGNELPPVVSVR
ncbi:hypothetical protein FKG94_20850 [Exilibacterium tricleocarpae]|uniref:HemY N-terminal domain-containing protein n=1 Tax=Exilibacterium tricleocarpae TaxID=2591008 RepID=A0A545T0M7_9GAMM|nr:heme biosynthesis HemY N-terminal domain-containing protein [Exilibacterium tricleocarpae]TQV70778.1 hypothetical protein FKG94_20850 [Exilibacterium tricleocarpae]